MCIYDCMYVYSLYVCMYVCMYVCIHVCMYMYVYVCLCMCVCPRGGEVKGLILHVFTVFAAYSRSGYQRNFGNYIYLKVKFKLLN